MSCTTCPVPQYGLSHILYPGTIPLVPSIISLVYFGLNHDAEVIFALGVSPFHPIITTPPTAVSNLLVLFLISFWG